MANYRKPVNVKRAKRLYLAGWDCYRIAELEGVGNHVIERRLREVGVTIRSNASRDIQRLKTIARKVSKTASDGRFR